MTIDKQLGEITEADLTGLITALVKEGKDVEFKRELNLSGTDAKRKFLRSVAAFANSQGGHIIFGIAEKDGVANSVHALADFNEDMERIRLRDFIRAHIEPKVYGFDFRAVPLATGGYALVLWVPRGWTGPHMVTFDGDNRFYFRHGNGTALMDVGEIRSSFAVAETLPERVGRLRLDRLSAISSGDVPRPLANPQVLVLHIIPAKALDPLYECDLAALVERERKTHALIPTTFVHEGSSPLEFDLDSIFTEFRQAQECFGYVKCFRSGVLEIVDALTLQLNERIGKAFATTTYERILWELFPSWLEAMRAALVEPPAFVALSFIGMVGRFPYVDPRRFMYAPRPIRHDPLLIRPSLVDSLDANATAAMFPVFNRVWQTCGMEHSVNFDLAGNWIGR